MSKPLIQVIVGTTRPSRTGRTVADWFMKVAASRPDMDFELVDLAEVNLPMYNESKSPMMGQYEHEHTKKWAETVGRADGYVWVTAEYNHTAPPSLLNAIDYLYAEWNHKPVAFVSYGAMGGVRAVEHLIGVANELKMVSTREHVQITEIWGAIDANGTPLPEKLKGDPAKLLDELSWWATITTPARQA